MGFRNHYKTISYNMPSKNVPKLCLLSSVKNKNYGFNLAHPNDLNKFGDALR